MTRLYEDHLSNLFFSNLADITTIINIKNMGHKPMLHLDVAQFSSFMWCTLLLFIVQNLVSDMTRISYQNTLKLFDFIITWLHSNDLNSCYIYERESSLKVIPEKIVW